MISDAVDRIAPVIARVAILCMEVSRLAIPTDPDPRALSGFLQMGVNHISAAYVKRGTATARNNWHISSDLIPIAGLASLRKHRVQLVALATTLSVCSFQRNSWSNMTPRYLWELDSLIHVPCKSKLGRGSGIVFPGLPGLRTRRLENL